MCFDVDLSLRTGDEMTDILLTSRGLVYVVMFSITLFGSMFAIYNLEKTYPVIDRERTSVRIYNYARFLYPFVLALWESTSWISLRILSNLTFIGFEQIADGRKFWDSDVVHPLCWFNGPFLLIQMAMISFYLYKTYSRFPTTECFPIEYSNVAALAVISGLMFFAGRRIEIIIFLSFPIKKIK